MQKKCKNCQNFFESSPKYKAYCSSLCRREYKIWIDREYKRKRTKKKIEEAKRKDYIRKEAVKRALFKNATNRGKPFAKDEIYLIMERKRCKFKRTPTELAYLLGRTKQSIEQKRRRELEKVRLSNL